MDGADWLKTQLTSFGCAACGQAYDPGRIRVLAERDGLFFVDLGCAHCGTQAVAVVTIQVDDDDVLRADPGELFDGVGIAQRGAEPAAEPVSSDDVLAMHSFLTEFSGDIPTLLARLDGRPSRELQAPGQSGAG
jgi:hypothetical protein